MNKARQMKGSTLARFCGAFCLAFLALSVLGQPCPAAEKPEMPTTAQKKEVESALGSLAKSMKAQPPNPEATYDLLISYLKANPRILGATLAFAPLKKDGRVLKTAPYVYVQNGQYLKKDLAAAGDYLAEDWYVRPVKLKGPYWSKPYFDNLGAQMNMITYSIPIYVGKHPKKLLGVLTSDLALK
jgi:hypothetical protein